MNKSGSLNANESKDWKGKSVEEDSMEMMKASGGTSTGEVW